MAQRRVVLVAVLAALVAANVAVARLSAAAFGTDGHNTWAGGEVEIADEPVAAGLFDVDGMLPNRPEVRCLRLRYGGTHDPAELRFYATGVHGGLAAHLDVVVETGPACDAFAREGLVYAGTLEGMPRTWADAASTRPLAPGERRAWRISVTLRADDDAQGQEATAGFLWEARAPGSDGPTPLRWGGDVADADPAVTGRSRPRRLGALRRPRRSSNRRR